MNKDTILKMLKEKSEILDKIEISKQQVIGQIALLRDMMKNEQEKPKEEAKNNGQDNV